MTLSFARPLSASNTSESLPTYRTADGSAATDSSGDQVDSFQQVFSRTSDEDSPPKSQLKSASTHAQSSFQRREDRPVTHKPNRNERSPDNRKRDRDEVSEQTSPVESAATAQYVAPPPVGAFLSLISFQCVRTDLQESANTTETTENSRPATSIPALSSPETNMRPGNLQAILPEIASLSASVGQRKGVLTPDRPKAALESLPQKVSMPVVEPGQPTQLTESPTPATFGIQTKGVNDAPNLQNMPSASPDTPSSSEPAPPLPSTNPGVPAQNLAFAMKINGGEPTPAAKIPASDENTSGELLVNGGHANTFQENAGLLTAEQDTSKEHSSGKESNSNAHFDFGSTISRATNDNVTSNTSDVGPARMPESPEPTNVGNPEPVRNLVLQLKGEDNRRVDVRLVDRGGELHVGVKSADLDLAQKLQEHMPELTSRLDAERFTSEVWVPRLSESTRTENGNSQTSSQNDGGNLHSDPNTSSGGRQGQGQQQSRPDWVDLLEDQIS